MNDDEIVPVHPSDVAAANPLGAALLTLNNAHAIELSWLEPDRLERLIRAAFLARRVGAVDAFLLAFDQAASYDSPNFLWFRARYPRFVYVDRIVVAKPARGRGLARRLYRDLFELAAGAGHDRVVCEVNATPPNPVSEAFHAALDFEDVGRARFPDGKSVRYFSRRLQAP